MNHSILLSPYSMGNIKLKNRIVMAPMTRSRAIGNIPNDLMATYYQQRTSAGLIITEGTSPSANGLGYARIPGIYSAQQVDGWKKVTSAVHRNDGKIFVQLMHTGRISHRLNLPDGAHVLAPSGVKAAGQIWTDQKKLQDFPVPKGMNADELIQTKIKFVDAAKNAIKAGFDGVELHGANGYLLEQFLSPVSNMRPDYYGGSLENRIRFVMEVVTDVAEAIGKEKTGIRLSPFGTASDMQPYPEIIETYHYLTEQLNTLGIAYIHIVDHSSLGSPAVPLELKRYIRNTFKKTVILSGGYDRDRAEEDLQKGLGDLVSFARSFINNPDFVSRLTHNWELSKELKTEYFYSANEKGYTDYPAHANVE